MDSFFLYNKSSTKVPKFITELNKILDMYSEISYFGKKSKYTRQYKSNKTQIKNSIHV